MDAGVSVQMKESEPTGKFCLSWLVWCNTTQKDFVVEKSIVLNVGLILKVRRGIYCLKYRDNIYGILQISGVFSPDVLPVPFFGGGGWGCMLVVYRSCWARD